MEENKQENSQQSYDENFNGWSILCACVLGLLSQFLSYFLIDVILLSPRFCDPSESTISLRIHLLGPLTLFFFEFCDNQLSVSVFASKRK